MPLPVLKPGEALIKVACSGICGTDLTIASGKHPRAKAPLILGHEFCGEVVSVHDEVDRHWVGKRVVVEPLLSCGYCRPCLEGNYHVCETLGFLGIDVPGSMAEYVAAPVHRLYDIGDLAYEKAALVEPLAVAVHDVRRSGVKVGEFTVVLGGGTIGQLICQVLVAAGAGEIIVTEPSPFRQRLLAQLPVKVVDPSRENIPANTADVVFETAGVTVAVDQAVNIARVRGTIVQISLPKEPIPVDLMKVAFKELNIVGCRVYNRFDYQAAIQLLRSGKINTDTLITHIMPLEKGAQGIELIKKGEAIKVLLQP
jgi:2-desacetyl-2-hydroxyethyl bacteriochlorophyllide A dehydrogenase